MTALTVFLVLAALAALTVGAVLVWVLPQELGTVTINGQVFDGHSAHAGHWLLASLGVFVAVIVIAVVVPVAVLLGTVVPLLVAAAGLGLVLAVLALLFSPVILLLWWLLKKTDGKKATMPS